MNQTSERWAVVGGGMLGMTMAHRLRQRGHAVTIFEAAPHWGGLASAWKLGDVTWDRFYHVILLSDARLRALLAELDLADECDWVETRTGFFTNGKLVSMSNSWEFLRFPPLGLVDKFRLALTILHASRLKDWKSLENIPVEQWLRKWSGDRTFEKIWLPLLRSKLGESYRETSAAFIWATIARMYAARRSGLKKEMFGYVRGGYARVLERFEEKLRDAGVEMRAASPVSSVERGPAGVRVVLGDGESQEFDRCVVTAASPLAARMCPDLESRERKLLEGVKHQGIVPASLVLKNPLACYYVTNITDDWAPFTAVIETSALVDRNQFGGKSLVYLPKYAAPDDPIFNESDESIRERFVAALRRMYPQFADDDVLAFRVARVKHVFALSTLGYSERLPPVKSSVPGLYLVNSSHIVNGTLNVNETIQLAERTLETIASDAPRRTPELAGATP